MQAIKLSWAEGIQCAGRSSKSAGSNPKPLKILKARRIKMQSARWIAVCVRERERQTNRQTEKDRDRETENI